jgi:hypothetical protein
MRYTFQQAYSKIIDAYFKDEIRPYSKTFCFCGTLGIIDNGYGYGTWDKTKYSSDEYNKMEWALLSTIRDQTIGDVGYIFGGRKMEDGRLSRFHIQEHPNYEEALFNGMCAALEVLREIHRGRGEITEGMTFTKRVLQTT